MLQQQQQQPAGKPQHTVMLDSRSSAKLTGIKEVVSYCDSSVCAVCPSGDVVIQGSSLKIESFDAGSGALSVTGSVDAVIYSEPNEKKSGLFARLFK